MGQLRDRMEQDLILRNLSPATRKIYLMYARRFVAHYRRPAQELGKREIRDYLLNMLQVEHLSYETYRQNLAAIKFLYTVTLERPWEVQHIPFPRHSKPLPPMLNAQQVTAVIASVTSLKYRVMIMAMYAGGLRILEVCRLRVSDIDSQRMTLRVENGKGGKCRYTLLAPRLLQVLREYWKQEKPKDLMFPGRTKSGHISPDSVRAVFKKALQQSAVVGHFTPHALRHSFATHLLDAGTELIVIQALMGHSNMKTTALYARVTIRNIQKVISPLQTLPPLGSVIQED